MTREGFIVIPQVGQVYVANLTLGQLQDQLYTRLGQVYSGVRRGQGHAPSSRSRWPGCGTSRSTSPATWCARAPIRSPAPARSSRRSTPPAGPTAERKLAPRRGSPRRQARRQRGRVRLSAARSQSAPTCGSRPATWCSFRCTADSSRSTGKVNRPAIYELLPTETLRDVDRRSPADFDAAGLSGPRARSTECFRPNRGVRAAGRAWWCRSAPTSSPAASRPPCRWRPATR